jgi:hypothetical protein
VLAPTPPSGPTTPPKKGRGFHGRRPKGEQIALAVAAANELAASPTYAEDFGANAPDPSALSYKLTNASNWREQWEGATKWEKYCSNQRIAWENSAMGEMSALGPSFDYASGRNADIAKKYGATTAFFQATKAIGQRAAASRKAKRSAATKAAKSTETAPPAVNAATAKGVN